MTKLQEIKSLAEKIIKMIDELEPEKERTPKQIAQSFFDKYNTEEGKKDIVSFYAKKYNVSDTFSAEVLESFYNWWTAPLQSGKKLLWETEKTFVIGGRIGTFFKNALNKPTKNFSPTVDEDRIAREKIAKQYELKEEVVDNSLSIATEKWISENLELAKKIYREVELEPSVSVLSESVQKSLRRAKTNLIIQTKYLNHNKTSKL